MSAEGLPERTLAAEDAYVARFVQGDDVDALTAAISAAVAAKRPQLAARLVGLLDEAVEVEPGSAVDRARRAAALVMRSRSDAPSVNFSELEAAWAEVREAWIGRMKRRMRRSLDGRDHPREGRIPSRNRRP